MSIYRTSDLINLSTLLKDIKILFLICPRRMSYTNCHVKTVIQLILDKQAEN